ncbi:hypothetical protein P9112_012627 [Eukaryota sp. TZLM1-RC]
MSALETLRRLKQNKGGSPAAEETTPNRLARLAAFRKARQMSANEGSQDQDPDTPILSEQSNEALSPPSKEAACPVHSFPSPALDATSPRSSHRGSRVEPLMEEEKIQISNERSHFNAPLELISEVDRLRDALKESQRNHELAVDQIRESESQRYEKLSTERNDLWMQIEDLRQKILTTERDYEAKLSEQREGFETSIEQLKKERDDAWKKIEELQLKIHDVQTSLEARITELHEAEASKIDGIVSEREQVWLQNEDLRQQLARVQSQYETMIHDIRQFESERFESLLAEKQKLVTDFEEEKNLLLQENDKKDSTHKEALESLTEEFNAKISDLEAQNQLEKEQQMAKLEVREKELIEQLQSAQNNFDYLISCERQRIDKEISQSRSLFEERELALQAQIKAERDQLRETLLEEEAIQAAAKLDFENKARERYEELVLKARDQLKDHYEDQLETLTAKVDELMTDRAQFEQNLIEQSQEKLDALTAKYEGLLEERAALNSENDAKLRCLLEEKDRESQEKIDTLTAKYEAIIDEQSKVHAESEAKLRDLIEETDLESQTDRIAFEERILNQANERIVQSRQATQELLDSMSASLEEERSEKGKLECQVVYLEQKLRKVKHAALLWRSDYQKNTRSEVEKLMKSIETRVVQHQQYLDNLQLQEQEERLAAEIRQQEREVAEQTIRKELEHQKRLDEEKRMQEESQQLQKVKESETALVSLKKQAHELWKVLEIPAEDLVEFLMDVDSNAPYEPSIHNLYSKEVERLSDLVPLMETITRREFIKYRIREFNKSASNPDRLFSGDSSRLIREEKHRKEFLRELHRLNEELANNVPGFENKYGKPLIYKGKSIREEVLKDLRSM